MVSEGSALGATQSAGGPPGKKVLLLEARYDGLNEAVSFIFDNIPLSLRGAGVLVKPNMLAPCRPDRAVTTHPALVRAVVENLLARGARPMVGDNPGARGYGINRICGRITQIEDASLGCFINLGERPVETALDSEFTNVARISRAVLDADLVVSLPKLKTHVQTIMTAGVKNTFGYLVGAEKSRMHSLARTSAEFGRLLADVFFLRPPDLTIIDAVTAMEGDGPSTGSPRAVGRLIAAGDAVAADTVACRLIGLAPEKVIHLAEARRRQRCAETVAVWPAEPVPLPDFRLPRSFARNFKSYLANWLVFSFLGKSRLRIRDEACSGCGECVQGCPAGAMAIRDGKPRIDRRICVACYCCHELCPQGAVELNPVLRALLRGKEAR